MNAKEIKTLLLNGMLSRRDFNRALGSLGLAAVTLPYISRVARAAGDVNYFTWAGYDDPTFFEAFKSKYGKTPAFTYFNDEDEALAKIRAGYTPTVAHPCADGFPRWRRAGVLGTIDTNRLEHWENLWPRLKNLKDQAGGDNNVYFAPFDWGNSAVAFRTDSVDPEYQENPTWEILYDKRYSGRLAGFDSANSQSAVAGLLLGFSEKDVWQPSNEQIEMIREKLKEQQPLIRFYWDDQTAIEQGLASGELVAAYAWNSTAVRLKREGVPVEYMTPKEGALFWVCGLVKLNSEHGDGDEDAIYDMINEMQSPEVGQYVFEEWGYGHSNMKAFEMVDTELLAELNFSEPTKMMEKGVFFQDAPEEINNKLVQMFNEVKAGF